LEVKRFFIFLMATYVAAESRYGNEDKGEHRPKITEPSQTREKD